MMLLSIVSYFVGILLLFERTAILVSNVQLPATQFNFLAGMYFFIGFRGSFGFFRKKGELACNSGKRRGSLLYFAGLLLIIFKLTFLGSLLQLIGFFIIFRPFLPDIYDSITRIPYVGRYLSMRTAMKKATPYRTTWTASPRTAVPRAYELPPHKHQ